MTDLPDGISITSNHKKEDAGGDIREELVKAIQALSEDQVTAVAERLLGANLYFDLRAARVWGDANRLHISDNVNVIDCLLNTRSGTITIEDDCTIGHRCMILTGNHNYRKKGHDRFKDVPDSGRDIHLKKGVWLGSGSIVLGPCVIGEDAVIAAGSVVTAKEIPAGTVWAGNPARQIREIDFEDE